MNEKHYVIVEGHNGERFTHGPMGLEGAVNRVQHINRRYDSCNVKILTELEYLELERDYIVNNTGATD